MFKKAILPLAIIIAGALTVSMLVIAKPKPTPRPAPEAPGNVKISVVQAKAQSLRLSVNAQGSVTPSREIDLISQVSGQIVSVTPEFADGGFFEKSQVLIQIDDRDYKAALLTAKASLAVAQRQLAEEYGLSRQAKREWRDLGNQSANDLFNRKPQLAAAKANLAAAQGNVDMAQLTLERTKIVVPFNGRVRQIFVNLGQYVSMGTRLATVYDSASVEVRIPLTEKQAALVDLPFKHSGGDTAATDLPKVTIQASVAGVQHQWQGVLARTDAFVDPTSRMYFAVVEVANPFGLAGSAQSAPLLPGLFVDAIIEGKQLDNVLLLPRAALYQREKLLVLDAENKVMTASANVLRKSKTQVWLQASIANKALISIEKQTLTPDGTLVEPVLINANKKVESKKIAAEG